MGCEHNPQPMMTKTAANAGSETAEALAEAEALKRARRKQGEVMVNGQVIPSTAIASEAQNQAGPRNAAQSVWTKATNALVVRALLLQEADRRAIIADPQQIGPDRYETEEEASIRTLLETVVDTKAVSNDEVKAEWERDPDRFRTPPLWEVSHILCACDHGDSDARMAAYRRCRSMIGVLKKAPDRFRQIAEQHSDCESKPDGGFLGQMRPGDAVPEFEAALKTLAEGETTSKPIRSAHGYHIVRLDALASGQVLPFDVVRPKIALALEKMRWARAASDFVDSLAAQATIQGVT